MLLGGCCFTVCSVGRSFAPPNYGKAGEASISQGQKGLAYARLALAVLDGLECLLGCGMGGANLLRTYERVLLVRVA